MMLLLDMHPLAILTIATTRVSSSKPATAILHAEAGVLAVRSRRSTCYRRVVGRSRGQSQEEDERGRGI